MQITGLCCQNRQAHEPSQFRHVRSQFGSKAHLCDKCHRHLSALDAFCLGCSDMGASRKADVAAGAEPKRLRRSKTTSQAGSCWACGVGVTEEDCTGP
eukprot:1938573-Pyramimonas_sp.AAC.1